MERYICIHGHFYQPPERTPGSNSSNCRIPHILSTTGTNASLPSVMPRTACREFLTATQHRKDHQQLLAHQLQFRSRRCWHGWQTQEPETYRAILDADKESQQRFRATACAIAQAYNHTILPLSNSRDKYTQILWGVRDFEFRFGRASRRHVAAGNGSRSGNARISLQISEFGSRYFRPIRQNDPEGLRARGMAGRQRRARRSVHAIRGPAAIGKQIAVFFYDGPISQAIAFEQLLEQGENFAGSSHVGIFRFPAMAADRPHRNRRRNLRSSSQARRHGAGLRPPPHRKQQSSKTDNLR